MPFPLFIVDAFTREPFAGNPAGVCLVPGPRHPAWMQRVAAEMNLSETAFLHADGDGFRLRWFTPTVEIDLCGHATLASAHVLWETGVLAASADARFHTRSGLLIASRRGAAGDGAEIEMDFPAVPAEPAEAPPELAGALGIVPQWVGRNRLDYLLLVDSEEDVRSARPDLDVLARLSVRGVIVTAAASPGSPHDFVSRFFAPAAGVPEDPVTGSAHCCLGPFWSERLGRTEVVGYQASARGGIVRVRVAGDRVYLGGAAVTVVRGEIVPEE